MFGIAFIHFIRWFNKFINLFSFLILFTTSVNFQLTLGTYNLLFCAKEIVLNEPRKQAIRL